MWKLFEAPVNRKHAKLIDWYEVSHKWCGVTSKYTCAYFQPIIISEFSKCDTAANWLILIGPVYELSTPFYKLKLWYLFRAQMKNVDIYEVAYFRCVLCSEVCHRRWHVTYTNCISYPGGGEATCALCNRTHVCVWKWIIVILCTKIS